MTKKSMVRGYQQVSDEEVFKNWIYNELEDIRNEIKELRAKILEVLDQVA